MAAPTLVSYTETAWTLTTTAATTASVSWQTGDVIVAVGLIEGTRALSLATATGLTFSSVKNVVASGANCGARIDAATAATSSSATVNIAAAATGSQHGTGVWVFRNSGGIGTSGSSDTTAKTLSLTSAGGADSAYVWALADFQPGPAFTAGTPTPTHTRQNIQENASTYTIGIFDLADQISTGAISYGATGGGTTGPFALVGVEIKGAGGGTAFTQTLTESVTLSDTRVNQTGKVFAESLTWSDVLARLTGKTLADTWTPDDVLVKQTGKALSESVTFSDVMTTTKVFLRTLAEVFTFSDTLTRSTGKVLSDAWTLSDVLGRFVGKTLSDLWTPSDTLVKQTQKSLSESVTLSDLLSTVKVFLRTLTESLTWSDTLARRTGKTLTETATLSDVLSTAGRFFRTLTESITFSDVFSGIIQSILAAAKACETFFIKADRGLKVSADTVVFSVAADSTLLSVSPDTSIAKVGADKTLSVAADITTFTDVGC